MTKAQLKEALRPLVRELMIEALGERVLEEAIQRVVTEVASEELGERSPIRETRQPTPRSESAPFKRELIDAAVSRQPVTTGRSSPQEVREVKKGESRYADILDEVAADKPDAYQQMKTANTPRVQF